VSIRENLRIVLGLVTVIGCPGLTVPVRGDIQHPVFLFPGTPAEARAVTDDSGTSVENGARLAPAGGSWTYRIVVLPGARCELGFKATGSPVVSVTDAGGKTLPSRSENAGDRDSVRITVAADQPLGSELRFRFLAAGGPLAVRDVRLTLWLPDRTGEGLGDAVESMMGLGPDEHASLVPRPTIPHTAFFFSQPYDAAMAMPTDAVQLYNGDPGIYSTWAEKGYGVQDFLHSRYVAQAPDEPGDYQTDRNGRPLVVMEVKRDGKRVDLAVGPISPEIRAAMAKQYGEDITIDAIDHYKIPTQARIEQAKPSYVEALAAGAQGLCFDEPEIWARAGYSEAFKQEWQARYGTAWQPPHRSVDTRYQSEQLKAFLIRRWVESILEDGRHHRPSVTRMIAMHSPINYYRIRMTTPHHQLVSIPALQEVVAEVWNDPFDVSFLEYSSFYHLVRGTGRRLWFMMDPWGDSPAMSLDFYRRRYGDNLLAALMFPQIDTYQPLIWPNRIYGHVPKEYETLINTVVGTLSELWRYPDGRLEAGSRGIGTFIADSMGWQRAEPSPSDFDGFDGLSLPLVQQGVPVEVLSLDRAAEPGYLDGVKCLLVSYDFLKPADASINRALADWTRQGGTLVCFGGTDAYNAVAESWWRRAGCASPFEDLFAQMGLPIRDARVLADPGREIVLEATTSAFASALSSLRVPLGPAPGEEQYRRGIGIWQTETTADEIVHRYPVTLYAPPAGAAPLYRIAGEVLPAAWEAAAGKGEVIFVGVAPGYLKSSKPGPAWVRALTRYALEKAGETYREQPYYLVHRGPYTAIRTLDKPYTAAGGFVDLLSPTLAVLENPVIPPQECAFLAGAGQVQKSPPAPVVSGRLRAFYERAHRTSFLVQAPAQTEGVARVWAGRRRPRDVKAFTVLGASVPVTTQVEGETVLLRYANDADGVVVRMEWEPEKSGG